ncbi:hypothetical protein QYF61_002920 [Mycteria americana]|uniref:Uncharacterized protein n=1 Tax=Mycteria americana TaxID=33587 RepID=A0AAN7S0T1_MYCAM|nr:hypothetical protein QYF61_002920 [Mycteria americana]
MGDTRLGGGRARVVRLAAAGARHVPQLDWSFDPGREPKAVPGVTWGTGTMESALSKFINDTTLAKSSGYLRGRQCCYQRDLDRKKAIPHKVSSFYRKRKNNNPRSDAKQSQFPQLLLIRLVLQTLHQLCCSLDTLQHLNVFLVVRGPKLNTVFEVWPHQCQGEGHDRFPSPAGHAISDTSQDADGLLGHLGTLPTHIQPAIDQHPRVLFCQAAFQPLFPKPVALHGVVVTQVQELALGLVESYTVGLGPSIQPVQVPLQILPTLKHINTPAQLGVICKLAEGALNSLIPITDKDIKQDCPQY